LFLIGKYPFGIPVALKRRADLYGASVRSRPVITGKPGRSSDAIERTLPHCTSLFSFTGPGDVPGDRSVFGKKNLGTS
jgi:hypothetical protein